MGARTWAQRAADQQRLIRERNEARQNLTITQEALQLAEARVRRLTREIQDATARNKSQAYKLTRIDHAVTYDQTRNPESELRNNLINILEGPAQ